MNTFEEINVFEWTEKAADDSKKEFRQAVHIILSAIASDKTLNANMILKGGILLAIRYQSNRFTKDIDLSTEKKIGEIDPDRIVKELNKNLATTAEGFDYGLVCLIQGFEIKPANNPDATFPSMRINVGYAYKGTAKHKRLLSKQSPTKVSIDYSFNEVVPNIENLEIGDDEKLYVYSLCDLIAEKIRSLLQQEVRDRYRRQDIFDLCLLLEIIKDMDEIEKKKIHDSLLAKSNSRNIEPTSQSLENKELYRRAERDYLTLADEIEGELPDFAESYDVLSTFYKSLPWV